MSDLKLNKTPVRTSRNFNINNIKIKDVEIPEIVSEFKSINIKSSVNIDTNVSSYNLKYGIGNKLIEQVKSNSNNKLKLVIDNKANNKIEIDYEFDENNLNLVEDIEIIANEGSKADVILKYKSKECRDENSSSEEYFHNLVIRVLAKENSNLNISIVNLLDTKANNFITIDNQILKDAKIDYYIVDFGGKNSITNYYSNLEGSKATNNVNTIYLGKENELFDLNYIGELKGEQSNIDIEVQGALKDNAKKHFKGTIDFKKGSKKAKGNENEFCMLLSNEAKSISLPMLLCSEEDVEGNHSSSAGKIDNKQLFYIMSRGFNYKEAMKLMVRANFNKIIDKIPDENLRDEILNEIDKRLD